MVILVPLCAGAAGTIAYALWVLGGEAAGIERMMRWIFDGSILMAGLACAARAATIRELRGAWLAFGLGMAFWAAGDVYFNQQLLAHQEIPYPSWADAGYVLSLPFFFIGTGLLIKRRIGSFTIDRWFDGAIAALAAAALATAFLAPALVGLTDGDPATVLVNLAYPLGDVIVLGFILAALVLSGVRGAGAILVVGAGLLIWCSGDMYYLYLVGTDSYVGGLTDCLWPLGAVLIATGALPFFTVRPRDAAVRGSPLVPPAVSALVVTAILLWDHFDRLSDASVWLAAATVLVGVARLALSFRENGRLLRELHGEVITDSLTGLDNRRKLLRDLEQALGPQAQAERSFLFALFDLDGFKSYNDNFGHPAGDDLLERLGAKLRSAVGDAGAAYRLGGDEFCVLVAADPGATIDAVERARAALSEKGEGFSIGASGGWLVLPGDATDASEALRIADQRMYEEKSRQSTRSMQQTHDLLLRILHEREPALTAHSDGVSEMAVELGRRSELGTEELDYIARAAQLHDIGKIAIPDEILSKPAGLDEMEWKLMRRHTLIGERIVGSSLAMKPVGRLVRSSHERWDGGGYPDGHAGTEIPLGSRIIFISDSFDAMTDDRSYSPAKTEREALAELRRCAGTQFDPRLVELFCEQVEESASRENGRSLNRLA
jgi:two-component system cell cycle response regulator